MYVCYLGRLVFSQTAPSYSLKEYRVLYICLQFLCSIGIFSVLILFSFSNVWFVLFPLWNDWAETRVKSKGWPVVFFWLVFKYNTCFLSHYRICGIVLFFLLRVFFFKGQSMRCIYFEEKHHYANAPEAWKLFFLLNEWLSRWRTRGKTRCRNDALVSLLLSVSLSKLLRLSVRKERKNSFAVQLDRENLRKIYKLF